MHINIRRGIALLFILAFFIFAPILLLYTSGYRYSFKKAQVEKTGALVIETEPKGATVFLNNKEIKGKTPLRLNNVLPDNYEITIKKDAYYEWSKKLLVKSQETTFAEDVVLFPKSTAEKINDYAIKDIFFSPQENYALFTTQAFDQDYLYLLNLNTRREKLLFNNNLLFENTTVIWTEDSSKVLFQLDNGPHVATTTFPQQKITLEETIANMPNSATNFHWDLNDSNTLYAQRGNSIYAINFLSSKAEIIHTLPNNEILIDYLVYENEIYLIGLINNKPTLSKTALSVGSNNNKTIELKHANYRFGTVLDNKLSLVETPSQTLYLIATDLDRILFSKDNIQHTSYNKKNNTLLLQSEQEISTLSLNQSELKEQTITRYSSGLQYAGWHHDSTNYVFALRDNKIVIIELDERDRRLIIELPDENISDFRVNADDDEIIFLKDNFLWELPIIE